jgi:hypothetical protein
MQDIGRGALIVNSNLAPRLGRETSLAGQVPGQ